MPGPNPKKLFLYIFVGSVIASALTGIVVIVLGNFGDFESKVLLTTFTVTCTSLLGLACGAGLESGVRRELPVSGIGFSVVSGALWLIAIWAMDSIGRDFVRTAFTFTLVAFALSHLTLISIARLDPQFRWAQPAVFFFVAALTAILLVIVWVDSAPDSDAVMRSTGVLAIVVAAFTIMVPVFHRLSSGGGELAAIDSELAELKARISELERRKREVIENDKWE